ncbi:unnamed protein product [Arabidopsis halleri]
MMQRREICNLISNFQYQKSLIFFILKVVFRIVHGLSQYPQDHDLFSNPMTFLKMIC